MAPFAISDSARRRFRPCFSLVLAISSVVLACRAIHGPFHLLAISVNSPVNAQGALGLSVVALVLLNSRLDKEDVSHVERIRHEPAIVLAILLLTTAGLWPALHFPLVSDDYTLARYGEELTPAMVRYYFTQPGGDGFYRPVGYISLGLDALWARHDPLGWHLLNLALHLANIVFVWFLARRILGGQGPALWAAALFALHGTVPLTAAFLAARFDVLAVFFVLAALILFTCYLASGAGWALAASLLCALLGFLTKEVAFCLPLLAALAARGSIRPRARVLAGYFVLAAAVFSYRFWLLGGIGGYRDPVTGEPDILHVSVIRLLNGFGSRIWSVFDFPLNWSREPEPWLVPALLAGTAALVYIAARTKASRSKLALTLAFVFIALLPVAHLLLVDSSLLGAWRFYLASAGFALFLAAALQGMGTRERVCAGVVLLAFQTAALVHNLAIWSHVAALADHTCASAARQTALPAAVVFPAQVDGVPFLRNGFEPCVAFHREQANRRALPAAR